MSGLVLSSPPGYYTVAVDDCALPEAGAKGWAIVAGGSVEAARLEQAGNELLSSGRIKEFHGSDFRPGSWKSYGKFLNLLKTFAEQPDNRVFAVVYLAQETRHVANEKWATDLLRNVVFDGLSLHGSERLKKAILQAAHALAWVAVYSRDYLPADARHLRVLLDHGSVAADIDDRGLLRGLLVDRDEVLNRFYDALRVSPNARKVNAPEAKFSVVDSRLQPLVQFADVIANFSANALGQALGVLPKSKARDAKTRLCYEYIDPTRSVEAFAREMSTTQTDGKPAWTDPTKMLVVRVGC